MTMQLEGRTAVVTGGGSGIGRAVCHCLVEAGAAVHILGRDAARLEETRAASSRSDRVVIHRVDLASPEAIGQFAEALRGGDVPVHALVNAAGIYQVSDLDRLTEADYDRMMDINLRSVILLTRALLPRMEAAGGGCIVNIASTLGYQPVPGCSLYSVSKAGLLMFTKSVALECAGRRIRCNAISPGVVRTPIFETLMTEEEASAHLRRMAGVHPLGRVGEPADIAAAVRYLVSDDAAWVTGVNLPVDGGISLT